MKSMMKRLTALSLALTLAASQLALPAFAENAENGTPENAAATAEIEVPAAPGGGNETIEVDIVVSDNGDGTYTAEMETPAGGSITDGGLTVEFTSSETTSTDGTVLSSESEYSVRNETGTYTAEGGERTETEIDSGTDAPEISVELVDAEGNLVNSATAGGEETVDEQPNGTTVTTTEREVTVDILNVTTEQTMDSSLPNTQSGYTYDTDGQADYRSGYSVNVYRIIRDEEGNEIGREQIDVGSSCEAREWDVWEMGNHTAEGTIQGLYCMDGSTAVMPWGEYRMVNLEDAIAENYISEEDAQHLRAIASEGFHMYWDPAEPNADGTTPESRYGAKPDAWTEELEEFNERLQAEGGPLAEGESLTLDQAVAVTQLAIWKYGNRFGAKGEELGYELRAGSKDAGWEMMCRVIDYLTSLEQAAPEEETQIISQEKFIDDVIFTVGDRSTGENAFAANNDNDYSNDVYSTSLQFSMVVTPGEGDDLILRVFDANGNEVKAVRIAGENQQDGIQYEDARQVTEDGKTYYVIEGMELTENSQASFNLKLEGYQVLQEGVYVFEAMTMNAAQAAQGYGRCCGYTQEQIDALRRSLEENPESEEAKQFMEWYSSSQNFITSMSGTAEVDVSMQIDLTFNVDEKTIVTSSVWRDEELIYSDGGEERTPGTGGRLPGTEIRNRTAPEEAAGILWQGDLEAEAGEGTTILDEAVPLAAAPKTGDITLTLAVISLVSLCGAMLLKKKEI